MRIMPTPMFTDTHVQRLKQLIGVDFAELGEIFEDRRHGPRGQINFRFQAAGKNARKITGDAATGDVREGRNPSAGNDIFQRG